MIRRPERCRPRLSDRETGVCSSSSSSFPTKNFREISYSRLLCSHDKGLECLPRRILLRGELLAAAVMGIATGLFRERMFDQWTVQAARYRHPLDQREVLARLLFVPARASGRERN